MLELKDILPQTATLIMSRTSTPGWPPGTTVNVYIDPNIIGNRRTAVITAFDNWTQSRGLNGSQVSYQIVSQPPPTGTGYTVVNQQPVSGNRISTDTYQYNGTGSTTSAVTFLSPTVTNPNAVLEAVSHDIGHPAGFGDCDSCAPSESVMATRDRYTNDNDVIGRATTPTGCDDEQLFRDDYNGCPPVPPAPGSGWAWDIYCCCWVDGGTRRSMTRSIHTSVVGRGMFFRWLPTEETSNFPKLLIL